MTNKETRRQVFIYSHLEFLRARSWDLFCWFIHCQYSTKNVYSYSVFGGDTELSFYPQELHAAEYIMNRGLNEIYQFSNGNNLKLILDKWTVIIFRGAIA